MSDQVLQFRSDTNVTIRAIDICSRLGIDVSTYLRMSLTRLVEENGIPFSMKLAPETPEQQKRRDIRESGISEWMLNEINEEIQLVRQERRERELEECVVSQ